MRARHSRLADKLMFVTWVTKNKSQRLSRLLIHFPVPVTFNLSPFARSAAVKESLNGGVNCRQNGCAEALK